MKFKTEKKHQFIIRLIFWSQKKSVDFFFINNFKSFKKSQMKIFKFWINFSNQKKFFEKNFTNLVKVSIDLQSVKIMPSVPKNGQDWIILPCSSFAASTIFSKKIQKDVTFRNLNFLLFSSRYTREKLKFLRSLWSPLNFSDHEDSIPTIFGTNWWTRVLSML